MDNTHNILDKSDKSLSPIPNGSPILKRVKFNWTETPGPIPEYRLIPKTALIIDGRYQRYSKSQSKIVATAAEWDFRVCDVLKVAERPDGTLAILDGGNRARSSFYRDDIEVLPCHVIKVNSLEDEAKLFVALNTTYLTVNPFFRYRAELIAGNPLYKKADVIVTSNGYKVVESGSKTGTFSAVSCLIELVKQDADLTAAVFHRLTLIAKEKESIPGHVLKGTFHLCKKFGLNYALDEQGMAKLRLSGLSVIKAEMMNSGVLLGKGGYIPWVHALETMINKGRRHKLRPIGG